MYHFEIGRECVIASQLRWTSKSVEELTRTGGLGQMRRWGVSSSSLNCRVPPAASTSSCGGTHYVGKSSTLSAMLMMSNEVCMPRGCVVKQLKEERVEEAKKRKTTRLRERSDKSGLLPFATVGRSVGRRALFFRSSLLRSFTTLFPPPSSLLLHCTPPAYPSQLSHSHVFKGTSRRVHQAQQQDKTCKRPQQ